MMRKFVAHGSFVKIFQAWLWPIEVVSYICVYFWQYNTSIFVIPEKLKYFPETDYGLSLNCIFQKIGSRDVFST